MTLMGNNEGHATSLWKPVEEHTSAPVFKVLGMHLTFFIKVFPLIFANCKWFGEGNGRCMFTKSYKEISMKMFKYQSVCGIKA